MSETRYVSLSIPDCMKVLHKAIVDGSVTGELVDHYELTDAAGTLHCGIAVYEKYYYRVNNRLTVTITVDDLEEKTRVHWISAGGGESVFWRFDWGASESFDSVVRETLRPYFLEEGSN